jgi:hypothetical protein
MGHVIEINFKFYNEPALDLKKTFQYDEHGNLLEEINITADNTISRKEAFEYEYDAQANWIKKVIYIRDQPAYLIEREVEYYD